MVPVGGIGAPPGTCSSFLQLFFQQMYYYK